MMGSDEIHLDALQKAVHQLTGSLLMIMHFSKSPITITYAFNSKVFLLHISKIKVPTCVTKNKLVAIEQLFHG